MKKWWVLASVACGTFMATLDSSIVNIALPTLTKELGTDLGQIKWVVMIYLLVLICLLLPFGRLSDQMGRRTTVLLGYLIFTFGSGLCGFADSLMLLVAFRAVQAVGASMLMVNGPALITASFTSKERGGALGILAMVVSGGLISGPSIGGFLIGHFGWPSIFWVNVPFGMIGMYLVFRFVERDRIHREEAPFDWAGALLQMIVLITFVFIFDPPHISVSGSIPFVISRWVIAAVTLVFALVFFKVESEVEAPVFDLSLLKNRVFWTANLASFLTFVSFSSVSVLMPFFLEEVLNFPPQQAGLFMTAIPLTIFVVAPISGRLSDRFGGQELSIAGTLIGALGLLLMAGTVGIGLTKDISHFGIIVSLSSIGLALGLFQSPNNNAIMGAVPNDKLGVASALLATLRNLGLISGTGLSTGLFSWRMSVTGDFVGSLHVTHFVSGMIAVAAMVAAMCKGRRSRIG